MARSEFGVRYDGPALADHTMDIRDLAPSLMALGELFTSASRLLHPDRDPVVLSVKATSEGSFDAALILEARGLWDTYVDVFSGDQVNAIANLEAIVVGTWGLFKLAAVASKKVFKKRVRSAPGRSRIEWADGTSFEGPDELFLLHENVEIKKTTRRVLEPLTRPGIDSITFSSEETETISIRRGDISSFDVPEPREVKTSYEVERTLTIASVVFKDRNKWVFSDGNATFHAVILDEVFRARVLANVERFGHGDMLRCLVRTIQTRRGTVLGTEYEILRVLDHISAQPQMPLLLDGVAEDVA